MAIVGNLFVYLLHVNVCALCVLLIFHINTVWSICFLGSMAFWNIRIKPDSALRSSIVVD